MIGWTERAPQDGIVIAPEERLPWPQAVALGGIIACGAVLALIGLAVMRTGAGWIERLMPPVVTGAVVAVIGLNLASIPVKNMAPTNFDVWMQGLTCLTVGLVAVRTRGVVQRLLILVGLLVASVIYAVLTNGLGLGGPVDLSAVAAAPWFGLPSLATPIFEPAAMLLIAPVAVVLVAENLGHLKAVGAMTGRDMNPWMGRAFLADGAATMLAGAVGGTGVTTYAENIGVMAATRIYFTPGFVGAGGGAGRLWLSPQICAPALALSLDAPGRRRDCA